MRRLFRFLGTVMLLVGAVMLLIGLSVFLTQGSQIPVTATVTHERCHPQADLATGSGETRCDAAVRYETRAGQVINARVTDAFPHEFRHRPGKPPTIRLRYSTSDPAHPFKQSNYMSAGEFLLLLGSGGVAATFGTLWLARADRIAENAVRRRTQGARASVPRA